MDSSDIVEPGQPVQEIPPVMAVFADALNIKWIPAADGAPKPVLEVRNTFVSAQLGLTREGIQGLINALGTSLQILDKQEGGGLVTPPEPKLYGSNGLPL